MITIAANYTIRLAVGLSGLAVHRPMQMPIIYITVPIPLNSKIHSFAVGLILFVALPLASEATEGEPVAASAVVLRADASEVEVQVVASCGVIEPPRPVASVARLKVQTTTVVEVVASAH